MILTEMQLGLLLHRTSYLASPRFGGSELLILTQLHGLIYETVKDSMKYGIIAIETSSILLYSILIIFLHPTSCFFNSMPILMRMHICLLSRNVRLIESFTDQ